MKTPFLIRLWRIGWVFIALSLCHHHLIGQADTTQEAVETLLLAANDEVDVDYADLAESLEYYRRRPLNLNRASEEELRELRLLSDIQIVNFVQYRQVAGELLALEELQVIPGFEPAVIQQLLPFVTLAETVDRGAALWRSLHQGKKTVFMRWSRNPAHRGDYTLGDPSQVYLRYQHLGGVAAYGFTAEKDPGEELFRGSNAKGFDFYSWHLFLREPLRGIKAVALGDYSLNIGQGLLAFTGFAGGKSGLVTGIKRNSPTLRPYSSVNEANFLRGGAVTVSPLEGLELTAFASYRRRDANLVRPDSLASDTIAPYFTTLDFDGLHRTPDELNDRRAVAFGVWGGRMAYQRQRWRMGANTLFQQFEYPMLPREQLYNQYYFRGRRLSNYSLDYALWWRNLHFFGESAMSGNGAVATVNGLLAGLDRRVDLAVLYRRYPRHYQALLANAFAENSQPRNESGLYIGIEVRPLSRWTLSAFVDLWRNPWLQYLIDAPSDGWEYRCRLTYIEKRRLEAYLELRNKHQALGVDRWDNPLDFVILSQRTQLRLHLSYKLTKALEWRSRLDLGFADNDINERQRGVVIYQDFLLRPIGFPLSFTTRLALFDTDGYAARFYAYENGLLNNFAIPAYYDRGMRFYINLRYRPARTVTLELRYAQTWRGEHVSQASTQKQLSVQVRWAFY